MPPETGANDDGQIIIELVFLYFAYPILLYNLKIGSKNVAIDSIAKEYWYGKTFLSKNTHIQLIPSGISI